MTYIQLFYERTKILLDRIKFAAIMSTKVVGIVEIEAVRSAEEGLQSRMTFRIGKEGERTTCEEEIPS